MSDLIVVAYPEEGRAARVLDTLRTLQADYLIDLEDAVVVTRGAAGPPKLHQAINLTAEGAVQGTFWGLIVGLVFTLPFPFMAPVAWLGVAAATAGVGAASGALAGHYADYGIDDAFVRELGEQMQPGSSALFVLVRKATPDKVIEAVSGFGGALLRTSLSKEAEAKIQAALSAGHAVEAAPAA